MSKRGKSITMYLMDGEATGRVKASISNWTGLGYKIPRDCLQDCSDVIELTQSSVYFLFGHSTSGKNPVYIGQAGIRKNGKGILSRLLEHDANPDKSYWTDAVVFTTSNNSFGPTELSFLENRFCNMAIQAGRYEVKNAVDPTPGNITEEKESELDEYADYAELILGVLGYKVFTPLADYEKNDEPKLPITNNVNSSKKELDLNSDILLAGGKPSSLYLKQRLIETGYIASSCNFTIAKVNKDGSGRYWANPPLDYLDSEWVLVFNDNINRQLHFFRIPAKAIKKNEVKTRTMISKSGKENVLIDLEVVFKNGKYVCVASGIDYQPWYVETMDY